MKKVLFLMLFLTIARIADMDAQVKIGENTAPRPGTVLDLNGLYKGGLLLPNIEITDMGRIPDGFSDEPIANVTALAGMVVWNTRSGWEGVYVWDGSNWQRLSGGTTTPPVINPERLIRGVGSFAGRTCFDVALNSPGTGCGDLTSRQSETLTAKGSRADFTNTITSNQTYTFTPSGDVSNVRFSYVEDAASENQIVESISVGNPANNIPAGTPVTCTIVYKSDLNGRAANRSTADALKVAIYVVYNDNATNTGDDVTLRLDVAIKDCACCGAFTHDGSWLNFMCYNLGADPTFTTPEQIKNAEPARTYGTYYRWGWKEPGIDYIAGEDNGGNPDDAAWGDGAGKNIEFDPCPTGYRVPSIAQWRSIMPTDASSSPTSWGNVWTWSGSTMTLGVQVGEALFLPQAGSMERTEDLPTPDAQWGAYWSCTPLDGMAFGVAWIDSWGYWWGWNNRQESCSVRCVAE